MAGRRTRAALSAAGRKPRPGRLGHFLDNEPVPDDAETQEEESMAEEAIGCARPTGSVVGASPKAERSQPEAQAKEEGMVQVRVGGKAPDFQAPAYHRGKFGSVKLSDHLGKWVLLCFYPGDFTFV
jgi:hypothetical protein